MTSFQDSKRVVREFNVALDAAGDDEIADVLARHVAEGYRWRGLHPFGELEGSEAVAERFWRPLRRSLAPVQRREDIFMAGKNRLGDDGASWVVAMGHLMGLFDAPWLDIPPTGRMAFLRYGEFHRVEGDRIAETALFFDLLGLMVQAGVNPLPPATGAHFLTPGPRTHDGLMLDAQDPTEGEKTHALITRMIDDLVGSGVHSPMDELRRTWHEDMIWFGPTGIGATYTLGRYETQHQGPFERGLSEMRFEGHLCHVDEGRYGGFFGWPNLSMTATGGFLGLPACERRTEMRVIDLYRRDGDKLAENWIFIDLPHFLALQGLDVLERMRELARYEWGG